MSAIHLVEKAEYAGFLQRSEHEINSGSYSIIGLENSKMLQLFAGAGPAVASHYLIGKLFVLLHVVPEGLLLCCHQRFADDGHLRVANIIYADAMTGINDDIMHVHHVEGL